MVALGSNRGAPSIVRVITIYNSSKVVVLSLSVESMSWISWKVRILKLGRRQSRAFKV